MNREWKHKVTRTLWLPTMLLFILIGCRSDDDSDITGPGTGQLILQAIVGNWTATAAEFTTTNTNPVQSRDVVADGGACELSVSLNNSFSLVIRNPGIPNPQITTGVFVPDGQFINVFFDSDPTVSVSWDFTIVGDDLSITGPLEYDFDDDGNLEQTSANMQFNPS